MRAVRHFNVVPAIPPTLSALTELATNLHWTWDRETQHLFARLDESAWEASGHDPLRLLATIEPERWNELVHDEVTVTATAAAMLRLEEAIRSDRWFQARRGSALNLVAYFSPE